MLKFYMLKYSLSFSTLDLNKLSGIPKLKHSNGSDPHYMVSISTVSTVLNVSVVAPTINQWAPLTPHARPFEHLNYK